MDLRMSTPDPIKPASDGHRLLQVLAWPAVALLGLIVLVSTALVAVAILSPAGTELGKLMSEAHAISRLVALVVIVPLLGVLAILDKIDGAVAATALSAIAGYVLGGTTAQ
jgi:hypothetical protein